LREPGITTCKLREPGITTCKLREPGITTCKLREPGITACKLREPGITTCKSQFFPSVGHNRRGDSFTNVEQNVLFKTLQEIKYDIQLFILT